MSKPKPETTDLRRGDRVRTRPGAKHERVGVFQRTGSNGLVQVLWDGNASVTYLALALIEKIEEPANV